MPKINQLTENVINIPGTSFTDGVSVFAYSNSCKDIIKIEMK